MKITKISVDLINQTISGVILLTITISFVAYILYSVITNKIDGFYFFIYSTLFFFTFIPLVFMTKDICDNKKFHKYTVYYNFKDSPKEMTTKQIINEIMKKDFFDNEIHKLK